MHNSHFDSTDLSFKPVQNNFVQTYKISDLTQFVQIYATSIVSKLTSLVLPFELIKCQKKSRSHHVCVHMFNNNHCKGPPQL